MERLAEADAFTANGVLFVTLEDETDIANLIIWPSLFERQRRLILWANMIGCRGKVQREGQVIHVIAEHLVDLSGLLGAVGEREEVFPLPHDQGDEAKHCSGPRTTSRFMGSRFRPSRPLKHRLARFLCTATRLRPSPSCLPLSPRTRPILPSTPSRLSCHFCRSFCRGLWPCRCWSATLLLQRWPRL